MCVCTEIAPAGVRRERRRRRLDDSLSELLRHPQGSLEEKLRLQVLYTVHRDARGSERAAIIFSALSLALCEMRSRIGI